MTIDPKDFPALADEYVLGLLDEATADRIARDLESNQDLADAVAAAQDRFLPLDMAVEPARISASLWTSIEERLGSNNARSASGSPETPSVRHAGNDNIRPGWRVVALSAIAASLILAITLVWTTMRTVEPVVVAVLLNEAGEVQAIVEDFGNETAKVRLLTDFAVPADKTMQVWTLPSRTMGPMSLGLLEEKHSAVLKSISLPRPKETQLYEITLENSGGSPTGRPTGPILAKGFAKLMR
ncbi:anti-sigma factor [Neorhizobium alkalisoli]|uniref:Anti-sigma-K factor RskA n=1 Tax=Neorhizobium alkalisoli TaxID=528178 RepID=A0A561QBB3_9HYPH|nr:anti-sigma factor [Neorhizobium alkalisoli]TWF47640.1 anti-sigma-K factor RskA [Neorhizobium alkalisoli]